jgi:hypothetical protein
MLFEALLAGEYTLHGFTEPCKNRWPCRQIGHGERSRQRE